MYTRLQAWACHGSHGSQPSGRHPLIASGWLAAGPPVLSMVGQTVGLRQRPGNQASGHGEQPGLLAVVPGAGRVNVIDER